MFDPVPAAANAPWRAAGRRSEPRLSALSYAILAPNPHNRQPWLVELVGADTILLRCDLERLLPQTDPYGRQITIGLGCFLETLAIAATAFDRTASITTFPDGPWPARGPDQRPVARIVLGAASGRDPLFDQIAMRRSVKAPYDMARTIDEADLARVRAAGVGAGVRTDTVTDAAPMREMREIMFEALRVEMTTPRTFRESIDLIRIGAREIAANPDGISLGGPMFNALGPLGFVTRGQIADPTSSAFAQGLARYRALSFATPAAVYMSTSTNIPADHVATGRAYMRLALTVSALGLALHPMSQVLQEYPEMDALRRRFRALVAADPASTVQMLMRIGYGPRVAATPRWPLETRMVG